MRKNTRIVLWVSAILLFIFGGVIFLNYYIRGQIEQAIEQSFSTSEVAYEEISVDIFSGSSSITKPKLQLEKIKLEADSFKLKDLSYWDYIFSNKISVGQISILQPHILIDQNDSIPEESGNQNRNFSKDLIIDNIHITGGSLKISEGKPASNKMFLSLNTFDLYNVLINNETLKGSLPMKYDRLEVSSDSLFYEMDEEHKISARNIMMKEGNLSVSNFKIIPKFGKREFDQRLSMERDRYELTIEDINLANLEWGFKNDTLQIKSPQTDINEADFSIYRNKMLPDDPRIRPLYSQVLRNLGVKIQLDSIRLKNSRIVYEEQTNLDRPPATLRFDRINSTMRNVTNMGMGSPDFPKTSIDIEADFMNESPLTLNWEFYVNDLKDDFRVYGELETIAASAVNPFLRPARNIELEGTIQSMHYNFYGDQENATGDMRMQFKDFKVEILEKNDSGKKKFLSGIVNFFINNDATKGDLEITDIKVERKKTASFWNYLWLCIREGVFKSFI